MFGPSFVLMASLEGLSLETVVYPMGCRATVSGLQSRADLNGLQVAVLSFHPDKNRYAVQTVEAGPGEKLLVKPSNLARCASPMAKLPDECLAICLSAITSWTDAARAAAVGRRWRRLLRGGLWPACASSDLIPLASWPRVARLGSDWEERAPFAHPPRWSEPSVLPSWSWSLRRMPCFEPGVAQMLGWLERMQTRWPGVAVPRWSGVSRRLAWMQGARTKPALLMWQLRGNIPRMLPSLRVGYSAYRSLELGMAGDSSEPAPPCLFTLPADAALFFALMPGGLGERLESNGKGPFEGFELQLEPWARTSCFYARANNLNNLSRMSPDVLGCDPAKMVSVAHESLNRDFHSSAPSALAQTTLLLCCDERSAHYGQIFRCETFTRAAGGIGATLGWWQISFAQLLHALLDALDEALAKLPAQAAQIASDWDRAWNARNEAAKVLRANLDRTCYLQCPSAPPTQQQPEGRGGRRNGAMRRS